MCKNQNVEFIQFSVSLSIKTLQMDFFLLQSNKFKLRIFGVQAGFAKLKDMELEITKISQYSKR